MHPQHLLIAIVLCLGLDADAQELPIGSLRLSIGDPQDTVMSEVRQRYQAMSVTGQVNTYFIYGKPPADGLVGAVAFKNGRLSWIQRDWGSFHGKVSPIEVSKALFSALESAGESSGTKATVSTKVQRVPGMEFKTVSFDFPNRRVTITTTEGDAKSGGAQVSIEESVRAQ